MSRKAVMQKMILLRGVPGSGKSTVAEMLLTMDSQLMHAEADQFFVGADGVYRFDHTLIKQAHAICQAKVRDALKAGLSVVVSNTTVAQWEVDTYANLAKEYGAMFVSMVVENRHGGSNTHGVPTEVVDRMKNNFSVKL